MAGGGRSPARGALSRLPRWVTVLGLVLVVGEFASGAALLAAGPLGGHAGQGGHVVTGRSALTRTVVLRGDVSGGCKPRDCGLQVMWRTPAGSGLIWHTAVPFTKMVRVSADKTVSFASYSNPYQWATCSTTVDGAVLSRVTTHTNSSTATCLTEVPGNLAVAPKEGTRTVLLQVAAHPGDTVTYATPTGNSRVDMPLAPPLSGDGGYSAPGSTFSKTVEVRAGGIVTIHTSSHAGGEDTCTITLDGAVISQVKSSGTTDTWARIP